MKSQVKQVEKEHEKTKAQYKTDPELTRETINVLTKANNELQEKVKTKDAYVAAVTEELTGSEASEEASGIEETIVTADVHRAEETQRVTMNNESTVQKYLACDKEFKAQGDLEKHLRDRHTEVNCQMCDKKLSTKKEVDEHICSDNQVVPQKCEKSYCQKEFVSTATLKQHMKEAHFGQQRSVCNKCGEVLNRNDSVKKHNETCCKSAGIDKSREVCKHWRRGHCNMGTECQFSHVGHQNVPWVKSVSTQKTSALCRNGPSCNFLARGKCMFKHHNTNNHQSNQNGSGQPRPNKGRQRCRFGAACDRVINCPNLHSTQDFPQFNNKQRFQKTTQHNNRNHNMNRS